MKTVEATYLVNIEKALKTTKPGWIGMHHQGGIVILTSEETKLGHFHNLHHYNKGHWQHIHFPPVDEPFDFAQPVGRCWLLVRARSENKSELNAWLYNEKQQAIGAFHAGDGVADVQTAANGDIWMSYFDEGIYGHTIGSGSLLCFDQSGRVLFDLNRFSNQAGNEEIEPVDDCYALNVYNSETIFAYYYADFPLLVIHRKKEFLLYHPPIDGSEAFAVTSDAILFADEEHGCLAHYSLFDDEIQLFQPVDEQEKPIVYQQALARGDSMLLINGRLVYKVNINSLSGPKADPAVQ